MVQQFPDETDAGGSNTVQEHPDRLPVPLYRFSLRSCGNTDLPIGSLRADVVALQMSPLHCRDIGVALQTHQESIEDTLGNKHKDIDLEEQGIKVSLPRLQQLLPHISQCVECQGKPGLGCSAKTPSAYVGFGVVELTGLVARRGSRKVPEGSAYPKYMR